MTRRQTLPRQWLVADDRLGDELWRAVRALPRGSGILFLYRALAKRERAKLLSKLRRVARTRGLIIVDEATGGAARVHGPDEIRQANLTGSRMHFLSPIFPTRSHPGWAPVGRMRAAALLRLSKTPVIALGGMTAQRFRRVQGLGFAGWAAIDAWTRS
jgi:thiamine-phosphate pyrophosphorylase